MNKIEKIIHKKQRESYQLVMEINKMIMKIINNNNKKVVKLINNSFNLNHPQPLKRGVLKKLQEEQVPQVFNKEINQKQAPQV